MSFTVFHINWQTNFKKVFLRTLIGSSNLSFKSAFLKYLQNKTNNPFTKALEFIASSLDDEWRLALNLRAINFIIGYTQSTKIWLKVLYQ